MNLQFNKVDISYLIVVIGLVVSLIISIFYGLNELSMSIASGLLGYIGGSAAGAKSIPRDMNSGNFSNATIASNTDGKCHEK